MRARCAYLLVVKRVWYTDGSPDMAADLLACTPEGDPA